MARWVNIPFLTQQHIILCLKDYLTNLTGHLKY